MVGLCRNENSFSQTYFFLFTASFNSLPGENLAALDAGIFKTSPVFGFRPSLAALSATLNLPKPTKATDSPLAKIALICSRIT